MALPVVTNSEYPTPDEIRNQLLSEIRYGYDLISVPVNVSKGTELYIRCEAVANLVSIAIQNNKEALADISPLDAVSDALEELAGIYGITRRAASKGTGLVTVTVSGGGMVTIPISFRITAPNGIQYETTQANTVATAALVEVQAVSTGTTTNQAANTVMTWDSAAIGNLGQNATVTTGGIGGGANRDNDDILRRRLIQRLSFPAAGGNTAQVIQYAEAASAAIEAAFVYPAVRGPASYDVALTEAGTGTGGDRQLTTTPIALAASNILANMPGSADLNTTTVSAQYVDVILNAALPLPVNAGGAGGGWRDAVPWPSTAEAGPTVFANITSVTLASNLIRVNSGAADPPLAGKRFGIWDFAATTPVMREFSILSVAGGAGAWDITIDPNSSDGMGFVTTGMYCSAGAVQLKNYATDFLAAVRALGPGEKTASADILPRGRRHPTPDILWPTSLTNVVLKAVLTKHTELADLSYAGRFDTGTTTTRTAPAVTATTSDPPRILVLRHFSIRAQV